MNAMFLLQFFTVTSARMAQEILTHNFVIKKSTASIYYTESKINIAISTFIWILLSFFSHSSGSEENINTIDIYRYWQSLLTSKWTTLWKPRKL